MLSQVAPSPEIKIGCLNVGPKQNKYLEDTAASLCEIEPDFFGLIELNCGNDQKIVEIMNAITGEKNRYGIGVVACGVSTLLSAMLFDSSKCDMTKLEPLPSGGTKVPIQARAEMNTAIGSAVVVVHRGDWPPARLKVVKRQLAISAAATATEANKHRIVAGDYNTLPMYRDGPMKEEGLHPLEDLLNPQKATWPNLEYVEGWPDRLVARIVGPMGGVALDGAYGDEGLEVVEKVVHKAKSDHSAFSIRLRSKSPLLINC